MKKKYINPVITAEDYNIPIMQNPESYGMSGNEPGGEGGEWGFGGDGDPNDDPGSKERNGGQDLVHSLW